MQYASCAAELQACESVSCCIDTCSPQSKQDSSGQRYLAVVQPFPAICSMQGPRDNCANLETDHIVGLRRRVSDRFIGGVCGGQRWLVNS